MPDRAARRNSLRGRHDRIRIDAVMTVEVRDCAGLTEMLNPQWTNAVTGNSTEPSQRRGVPIQDRDDAAVPRQAGKQAVDM